VFYLSKCLETEQFFELSILLIAKISQSVVLTQEYEDAFLSMITSNS